MTAFRKTVPITRQATAEPTETPPAPARLGWEPFASLRQEIDRLFDDMMPPWSRGRFLEARPWPQLAARPAADILEKDGEFVVALDVPGMDEKEDFEVKLSDGTISIRGERSEEKEEEKEDYRLCERRHGAFMRSFTLPASVDPEKVTANYEKGVLTVHMPKTEAAKKKQRKIEVKAA